MKVSELIEQLQKVDPDLPVYVMESDGTPSCSNECCYYSYSMGSEYSEAGSAEVTSETRMRHGKYEPFTSFRITVY